jgi:DNA repair photolyase
MPFDFNNDPVKIYGIWPLTPFPVEVSIYGVCSNSCFYCFSNLNRTAAGRKMEDHRKNPVEKVISHCEKAMRDEKDPIGYFLRERYPVCFSNTTDPFLKEEKTFRCSEAFLKWAQKRGVPLWIQTKGGVLLEDFDRYKDLITAGKDAVYITLTTLDDGVSRKIEPGAPVSSDRLRLMRMLSDRGVPVVAACNPYLKEWCPEPADYTAAVQSAGARGIWLEQLHFSASQIDALPESFGEYALKANLLPMYYIGELKSWYLAAEAAGIDFYPTPQWDEMFGYRSRFPECANPAWFGDGRKTFSHNFDLMREISRIAHEGKAPYDDNLKRRNNGKPTVVFWDWIEDFLRKNGCPNPVLRVEPFWVPFNATQTGDHRYWKARLGKEAPLIEILKHFFNEPGSGDWFFYISALTQTVYDFDLDCPVLDELNDSTVAVFNPKNRHDCVLQHDRRKIRQGLAKGDNSYIVLTTRTEGGVRNAQRSIRREPPEA